MITTTKLWWLCYKAIPLVFDNSLSYLEMLARLLEYVNNLKDALKELYETVENLDEKVEQYYSDLLSRLDELETTLRNYIDSELQNCKDELLETIEENNTAMNQKIQDFIDYINSLIGEVKDVCFNPTNGHFENVCNILQDIYTHMQIDAMTVGEFDSTNYITVEYFDDFGLTAQEFDLRSKLLLTDFWKNIVDEKLSEIGNLENLKTLSKNSLVSAINEVQSTTVNQSGSISNLITRMNTVEKDVNELNSRNWLNEEEENILTLPINTFVYDNNYVVGEPLPESTTNYNIFCKKLTETSFLLGVKGNGGIFYQASITTKPTYIQIYFPDDFYNEFTVPNSSGTITNIGTAYFINNGNNITATAPLELRVSYNSTNRRYELYIFNRFISTNQMEYNMIGLVINNNIIELS